MNLRLNITLIVSKLTIKLCRLTKWGGTTLPGKLALKLYPGIIDALTKDFNVIMVTGTNGKTTTTRVIGEMLSKNGITFITNKSGANLVGGVITTFIEAVNIKGQTPHKTALIEIDEAAFNVMSRFLKPNLLVVTNFFRDQLDRYGELYTTLNGVREGIGRCSDVKLILNADDSLCASLGHETKNVIYYGLAEDAVEGIEESMNSDAMFCIFCKAKYEYKNHVYGHLGFFRCPECGYERPHSQITGTKILELSSTSSTMEISTGEQNYTAKINLPGLYNAYNALAAVACSRALELPDQNVIEALASFECGFGRMETINTADKTIKVILVKNPTGFNQVLNYLLTEVNNMHISFIINDKLADGTDISWLWDVEFEKLQKISDNIAGITTSGLRAEDMAVRLKYAGLDSSRISIEKDYHALIKNGLENTEIGQTYYILPTYTAMLEVRKVLRKMFNLKEFWK